MKNLITLSILLFSLSSYSNPLSIGLGVSVNSKKLDGTLKATNIEGKLVSSSNFHAGINIAYNLTNSTHLLLDYYGRVIDFDNTNKIIEGDKKFSDASLSVGARWILMKSVAFRLMYTSEKDLAFTVDANNKAVLYSESLGYISVFYDQIIFLTSVIYLGFRAGYDVPSSGDTIIDRSGTRFSLFAKMGGFEINYEKKSITKSTEGLDFIETDSAVNILYGVRF